MRVTRFQRTGDVVDIYIWGRDSELRVSETGIGYHVEDVAQQLAIPGADALHLAFPLGHHVSVDPWPHHILPRTMETSARGVFD